MKTKYYDGLMVSGDDCEDLINDAIELMGDFQALDIDEVEYCGKKIPYLINETKDKQISYDIRGYLNDKPALLMMNVCGYAFSDDGFPQKFQMFVNNVKTDISKSEAVSWLQGIQKYIFLDPAQLMDELSDLQHLYKDIEITDVRWDALRNPISGDQYWKPHFLIIVPEDE